MAVHVERLPVVPGLGRSVRHDSRSVRFALPVLPTSAIASQHWQRRVPIFDQGDLGSCTGNAAAGWIATDDATRQGLTELPDGTLVAEGLAVDIYSAATRLDDTPGGYYAPDYTDTGSDGLSVSKVLQARGLAISYSHAFSLGAVYSALQSGPGLLGIEWYESMFDTDASGHIKVDSRSGLAGGHEILVSRLDVAGGSVERIWIDNSWGTSWGVAGSAWFTPAELTQLLADQGDFTVPAAPVVAPTPAPTPVPVPGPQPVPADPDVLLWSRTKDWAAARHTGGNKLAATALAAWAKAKGLA